MFSNLAPTFTMLVSSYPYRGRLLDLSFVSLTNLTLIWMLFPLVENFMAFEIKWNIIPL